MIVDIDEQPTDDVWILYDTGSAVTVCPHGFQQELGTKNDNGGPRCEAATGNAVTVEISDTYFSFWFRVSSVTKPIVLGEGLFQAGCIITPSGQTIKLHRRQRESRSSTGGKLEVLTTAAVRTNPEVQGLPVVAQDPGDVPMPEPQ